MENCGHFVIKSNLVWRHFLSYIMSCFMVTFFPIGPKYHNSTSAILLYIIRASEPLTQKAFRLVWNEKHKRWDNHNAINSDHFVCFAAHLQQCIRAEFAWTTNIFWDERTLSLTVHEMRMHWNCRHAHWVYDHCLCDCANMKKLSICEHNSKTN